MTPTQRTTKVLKGRGLVYAVVERWNPYARIRQDLFGIIDIIVLDPARGVVGIQSTGSAFAEHHRKLTQDRRQACVDWLSTPRTALELWGWRKIKVKRGGKAVVWQPRIRVYTLADFLGDPFGSES